MRLRHIQRSGVVIALVPAAYQDVYMAALLGTKNPTVIAFYMIWVVGMVRQMLLTLAPAEHVTGSSAGIS